VTHSTFARNVYWGMRWGLILSLAFVGYALVMLVFTGNAAMRADLVVRRPVESLTKPIS
jgi:FtsH-binding integral membrane protein